MFFIPRVNVVESDEGFSIEVFGRNGLRYVEGEKSLEVEAELATGPYGLIVYPGSIMTWSTGELIDEEERARIIENIRSAFRFRGMEIDVL
jgi:hypothetical protein